MNIEIFDIVLIAVMVLVIPAVALRDARQNSTGAKAPGTSVRPFVTTVVVEVVQVAAVATWWFIAQRDFGAIGLNFETGGDSWQLGAMLALGTCACLIAQTLIIARNPARAEAMRKEYASSSVGEMIPTDGRKVRWWTVVSVTAAIGEEFRYRGFLIVILSTLVNPWIAMVISSMIFGLAHIYMGVGGFIKTAVNGAIMGTIFLLTGSLWAPILVHFTLDLSWGLLMRRIMATAPLTEPAG